jgi:hypothetical protein
VNAQFLGDLSAALAMGRPHPPADISLDGLAVRTHWSVPPHPWWLKLSEWKGVIFLGRGGCRLDGLGFPESPKSLDRSFVATGFDLQQLYARYATVLSASRTSGYGYIKRIPNGQK